MEGVEVSSPSPTLRRANEQAAEESQDRKVSGGPLPAIRRDMFYSWVSLVASEAVE
jgi:hypothetical protein